jgi:5-formyltetrahydrofolate cyclo-ligase
VTSDDAIAARKLEIRGRVLAARALLHPDRTAAAAEAVAAHVGALASDLAARTVCAYVSVTGEPGTGPLIALLHDAGVRVLLPLLRDDLDLDWAEYRPGEWRPARFGLVEPTASPLGTTAVQLADLIVCPGVGGTPQGARLGRGGGSYDRALARALPQSLRCLVLYDGEVLDDVPTEPHDQLVDVIVTPDRVLQTSGRGLEMEGVGRGLLDRRGGEGPAEGLAIGP